MRALLLSFVVVVAGCDSRPVFPLDDEDGGSDASAPSSDAGIADAADASIADADADADADAEIVDAGAD